MPCKRAEQSAEYPTAERYRGNSHEVFKGYVAGFSHCDRVVFVGEPESYQKSLPYSRLAVEFLRKRNAHKRVARVYNEHGCDKLDNAARGGDQIHARELPCARKVGKRA